MNSIHILLVEDNQGDILLTSEALEEVRLQVDLSVVRDGREAIDFVNKAGNYSKASAPDIILLDINLPKKNGHEVLLYLKQNKLFRHIPVIMLTTSSSQSDIAFCNDNLASYFITKPVDVDDFSLLVSAIDDLCKSLNKD